MFKDVRTPNAVRSSERRPQGLRAASPTAVASSLEDEVQRLRVLLERRRQDTAHTPAAATAAAAQKRERRSPPEALSPYAALMRAQARRQRREGGWSQPPPPPPPSGALSTDARAATPEAVYTRFRAQHRAASWAAPRSPIPGGRSPSSSSGASEILQADDSPPCPSVGGAEGRPTARYAGTPPRPPTPGGGPVTAAESSFIATPPPLTFSCETSLVLPPAYRPPPPYERGGRAQPSPLPRLRRATPLKVGFALTPHEQQQEEPQAPHATTPTTAITAPPPTTAREAEQPVSVVELYQSDKASWAALRAYYDRFVKGANKTPPVRSGVERNGGSLGTVKHNGGQ